MSRKRRPELGATRWSHVAAAALAAAALALGTASCGDSRVATAESGPASGRLTISAPPGYIDAGPSGTVARFEAQTGVSVDYREEVAGAESFFHRLEPLLERGESGGRSILVVPDWLAKQMYERGYLQELDHEDLPTVYRNLRPRLRHPAFDPERSFSVPWQSNMTGLWLNLPRALSHSVVEFFDPDIAGKVTMMDDLRESVPIVMLAESKHLGTASAADWLDAIKRIKIGHQVGQIRSLTGTEYTQGLNSGRLIGAVGRSIDAPLIHNPKVEWVRPDQGCVLSSENMVIPVGAPNTAAALAWMSYAYRPQTAAHISEQVAGVSPVPDAKHLLERRDSKLAQDPLRFPAKKVLDACADEPSPPEPGRVARGWHRYWKIEIP
jgi:spermidine/putrescine transport system substrate-binding protein